MPRINLLPVRALARLEQAKQELVVAALANVVFMVVLGAAYQVGAHQLESLSVVQAQAVGEVDKLAGEVQQTQLLKAKSAALLTKLDAIEKLRGQKTGPAQMLAFFSDVMGELPRVWLIRLSQQDELVTLEGGAMAQGDISAFQLALGERRPAFRDIELALVSTAHGDTADFLQWTIRCKVPADPKAAP